MKYPPYLQVLWPAAVTMTANVRGGGELINKRGCCAVSSSQETEEKER